MLTIVNYLSKMYVTLLEILIVNVIIVCSSNELAQNVESQESSITTEDLNKLIKRYPAFLLLTLQRQEHYTGKDVSGCPMPYNENTVLDDPDVSEFELFSPRECSKPWTWTYKNYIDVPVPINGTIGKRLGNIIQPFRKDNTNIIQCYSHYLNVMESVGLTFIDRFCLFAIEVMDRVEEMESNPDYVDEFSLFDITINFPVMEAVTKQFMSLFTNISFAFLLYYVSTLPLDCVANAMKKFRKIVDFFDRNIDGTFVQDCYNLFLNCRELMKSRRNYAVLEDDDLWKWDITSDNKPDDNLLIMTQFANIKLGCKFFTL